MSLDSFLMSFGYIGVLVGAIFEGETILVVAGLAIHAGYLHMPGVFLCAFIGAMVGDTLFFCLGRYGGERVLNALPFLQKRLGRPQQFIHRHAALMAFALRFMYGLRHIVPFSVGMSPIPLAVFLLCNACGAAVWVVLFGIGGYLFGEMLAAVLGDLKRYERTILLIAVIGVVAGQVLLKLVTQWSRKLTK